MAQQTWSELSDHQAEMIAGGSPQGFGFEFRDEDGADLVNPQGTIVSTVETAIVTIPDGRGNGGAANAKVENAGQKFVD